MAPRFLTEQLVESGEMGRLGMHIFGKKKQKQKKKTEEPAEETSGKKSGITEARYFKMD